MVLKPVSHVVTKLHEQQYSQVSGNLIVERGIQVVTYWRRGSQLVELAFLSHAVLLVKL